MNQLDSDSKFCSNLGCIWNLQRLGNILLFFAIFPSELTLSWSVLWNDIFNVDQASSSNWFGLEYDLLNWYIKIAVYVITSTYMIKVLFNGWYFCPVLCIVESTCMYDMSFDTSSPLFKSISHFDLNVASSRQMRLFEKLFAFLAFQYDISPPIPNTQTPKYQTHRFDIHVFLLRGRAKL